MIILAIPMIISANADAFSQMPKTFSRDVYSNYSTYNLLPTLKQKTWKKKDYPFKGQSFHLYCQMASHPQSTTNTYLWRNRNWHFKSFPFEEEEIKLVSLLRFKSNKFNQLQCQVVFSRTFIFFIKILEEFHSIITFLDNITNYRIDLLSIIFQFL